MRPLIVGQAPPRGGNPMDSPISNACGRRLADLMSLDMQDYLDKFDRVNIFEHWTGKKGKGDAFDLKTAKLIAKDLLVRMDMSNRPIVLLLGRNVAQSFGVRARYFESAHRSEATFIVVPHPSRVNRWWNDPENVKTARFYFGLVKQLWGNE